MCPFGFLSLFVTYFNQIRKILTEVYVTGTIFYDDKILKMTLFLVDNYIENIKYLHS
jgi:hypothetical protein